MGNVVGWILAAFFSLNAILTVGQIGKERTPLTPGMAMAIIAINLVIVAGLLFTMS